MRVMFIVIVLGVLAIAGYLAYVVRTVDHDPAVWHVDPLTVPPSDTPNSFRVAPVGVTEYAIQIESPIYDVDARTLATAFDEFVMGQPRVERVAGTVEEAWLTYVQRTEQLQLPDYISVRFYDLENLGNSTIAIYSRSRFGYSDMGVNEGRVRSWLSAIESFEREGGLPPAPAAGDATADAASEGTAQATPADDAPAASESTDAPNQ